MVCLPLAPFEHVQQRFAVMLAILGMRMHQNACMQLTSASPFI